MTMPSLLRTPQPTKGSSMLISRCRPILLVILSLGCLSLGCSASRALDAAPKKDRSILRPGVDRDRIRAEFGTQGSELVVSKENADLRNNYDVYRFKKGSGGAKYVRSFLYGVLAFGTLGASELITNPAEKAVQSSDMIIRIYFGADNLACRCEEISDPDNPKLMFGN